jgi:hypothetical protein
VVWGLWIYYFDSIQVSFAFQGMLELASPFQWMVGAVLVGAMALLVNIIYSATDRFYFLVLLGSVLVSSTWWFIFLVLVLANYRSTATVMYGFTAFVSLMSFLDLSGILHWRLTRAD